MRFDPFPVSRLAVGGAFPARSPHPPAAAAPPAQHSGKMAAGGGAAEPGWEVAVRPLLSASYSAFEMKELPQLLASVIER